MSFGGVSGTGVVQSFLSCYFLCVLMNSSCATNKKSISCMCYSYRMFSPTSTLKYMSVRILLHYRMRWEESEILA